MIAARGLTKRYGVTVAVQDPTFTVRPGVVTGFLGPNGAATALAAVAPAAGGRALMRRDA